MRVRRRLASAALAVGLVGGLATPAVLLAPAASAHAVLLEVEPADGSTVDPSPDQVVLTFNEHVNESFATIAVTTEADRTNRAVGEPVVDGPEVSSEVEPLDPGQYTVGYRVTSADGHVVSGSSSFTVAGADEGAGDTDPGGGDAAPVDGDADDATDRDSSEVVDETAQDGDDSGVDPVLWVVGGLAVLLVGGAFLLLRRGN